MTTNDTQDSADALVASRWEAMRDEVSALSLYPADWDGEGADRVPFALVQATLRWFERLEASGGPVPSVVYPTAGGTPVVEWYSADTSSYVAYVRRPDRVDLVYQLPGGEPTHVVLSPGPKAPTSAAGGASAYGRAVGGNRHTEPAVRSDSREPGADSDSPYTQAA